MLLGLFCFEADLSAIQIGKAIYSIAPTRWQWYNRCENQWQVYPIVFPRCWKKSIRRENRVRPARLKKRGDLHGRPDNFLASHPLISRARHMY